MSENQEGFINTPFLEETDASEDTFEGIDTLIKKRLSSVKSFMSPENTQRLAEEYKQERAAGNERLINDIAVGASKAAEFAKETVDRAEEFIQEPSDYDEETAFIRGTRPEIGIMTTLEESRFERELAKTKDEGREARTQALLKGVSKEFEEGGGEFGQLAAVSEGISDIPVAGIRDFGPSVGRQVTEFAKATVGGTQASIYAKQSDTTQMGALGTAETLGGFFVDILNFVNKEGTGLLDVARAALGSVRPEIEQNPLYGKNSILDMAGPYFGSTGIRLYDEQGNYDKTIGGADKFFLDLGQVYSTGVEKAEEAIEQWGKGFNDSFKQFAETDKTLPMYYADLRRRYLEVPYRYYRDSDIYKFGARMGMSAPWAGLYGTLVGGQVVFRNFQRGLQGFNILRKAGIMSNLKTIPTVGKTMLDISPQGKLPPDSLLAIVEKYDMDAPRYLKSYRSRGMSEENAIKFRRNVHADFLGTLGAASAMQITDMVFGEDNAAANIIAAISGYLTAAPAYRVARAQFTKSLGSGVSSLSQVSKLMTNEEFADILANSQSVLLTPFRRSVLYSKGFSKAEIKTLMDASLDVGETYKTQIRKAKTVAEKQNLLTKAISEKVFAKNAKLDGDTIINGRVNPYSQITKLYKTDKKSIELVAGFKNYIENLRADPKSAAQANAILNNIRSTIVKVDNLTLTAPNAMKDFPLFFDQMTGLATLHSLRAQLMQTAQYSVMSDGFLAGGLIAQIEEYNKLHKRQADAIQETMLEIKKGFNDSSLDTPEEVQNSMNLVQKELIDPWVQHTEESYNSLVRLAEQPFMKDKQLLLESETNIKSQLGFFSAGGAKTNAENAIINERLFSEAFDTANKKVTEAYGNIRATYGNNPDYDIFIGNSLTTLGDELADKSLPITNQFVRLYGIPLNLAKQMQREMATRVFMKEGFDNLSNDQKLVELKEIIKFNVSKSGEQSSEAVNNRIDQILSNNVGQTDEETIGNLIDYISRLDNAAPATMSVSTFLDFKRQLNSQMASAYRAKDFNRSRVIANKLDELNQLFRDSVDESDPLYTALDDASALYKEVMVPYRETGSPLMKIKEKQDKTGQPIDKYKYFNLFLEKGDRAENAEYFKKAFFDPDNEAFEATGGYNPEAIEQLKFAMGIKLIGGREGNRATLSSSNIDKYGSPINTFKEEILEPFRSILTSAGQDQFVNYIDDFAKYFTRESKDLVKAYEVAEPALLEAFERLKNTINTRIKRSSASKLGATQESILPEFFDTADDVMTKPKTMKDVIDILLSFNAGDSVTTMMSGGATGFVQRLVLGGDSRTTELLKKQKDGTLDIDTDIGKKATDVEMRLLTTLDEDSMRNELLEAASDGGRRDPMTPFVEILLDEVAKASGADKANEVRKSLGSIMMDEWMKRAFPPVKKMAKRVKFLTRFQTKVLDDLVGQGLAKSTEDAKNKIAFGDSKVKQYLTQNDPNFNAADYAEYTFNLGVELDMIGANTFYRENEKVFKTLFDKDQIKTFNELTEVVNVVADQFDDLAIGGIPKGYTTAMLLGRVYNAMKGVVSPRYLIGEKLIMDYRLTQAKLLQEVLTDKETSKALLDVFRHDTVYNRKAIRKAARAITLKAAALGLKTVNAEEYAKDLETIKLETRRLAQNTGVTSLAEQEKMLEETDRTPRSTTAERISRFFE